MVHTWELVAYSWVFACSCFVVCCCLILFSKRKSYTPFRLPDVFILIAVSLCGQIHSWSTLLSAIDFSILPWMRLDDAPYCSLWTYWAPYFLGLNGWLCLLIYRIFLRRKKTEIAKKFKIPCFITLGTCILTMAAICTCGTVTACERCPYSRIFLASWTGVSLCALFILWVYLEKNIRHHHLSERVQIRIFSIFTGVIFLIILIPAIIYSSTSLDFLESISGEAFLSFVVPLFHVFFTVIFILPHSFRAWREDLTYSERLFVGLFNRYEEATSVYELSSSDLHMELFLEWCGEQTSIREEGGVIQRSPHYYVSCYRQIQTWEKRWSNDGKVNEEEMNEMREVICESHFKTSCNEIIPIGTKKAKRMSEVAVSKTTFSPAKRHVLAFFQKYFWKTFVQNFKAMGFSQEFDEDYGNGEDLVIEKGYNDLQPLTPGYSDGKISPQDKKKKKKKKQKYEEMEESDDSDNIIVYTELDEFEENPGKKRKIKNPVSILRGKKNRRKKNKKSYY